MTHRIAVGICCAGLVCLASGCAPAPKPLVVDRSSVFKPRFERMPEHYQVSKGDTLYSIAWRYGLDTNALALNNRISKPFTIFPGQVLSLVSVKAPARTIEAPLARPPKPQQKQASEARAPQNTWLKPVSRPVSLKYSSKNKGVNYLLNVGDDVKVVRSGKVVYAGNGLGGFQRLVIVQHDSEYLSAYSFNHELLVREGEQLRSGDLVTRAMGSQGLGPRGQTLHFEIRRHGQPVDPGKLIGSQ